MYHRDDDAFFRNQSPPYVNRDTYPKEEWYESFHYHIIISAEQIGSSFGLKG